MKLYELYFVLYFSISAVKFLEIPQGAAKFIKWENCLQCVVEQEVTNETLTGFLLNKSAQLKKNSA